MPLGWCKVSNITLIVGWGSWCQDLNLGSQVKQTRPLSRRGQNRAEVALEGLPVLRVEYLGVTGLSQARAWQENDLGMHLRAKGRRPESHKIPQSLKNLEQLLNSPSDYCPPAQLISTFGLTHSLLTGSH